MATAQRPRAAEGNKADKVVYELLKQNKKIKGRTDVPAFKPDVYMKNTSTVSIDGRLVNIRYLKGYKSIKVEEQEPDNRPIEERIVNSDQNRIHFVKGRLEVSVKDSVKIEYMDMCSENVDSEHRWEKVAPRFRKITADDETKKKEVHQKNLEKAMKLADAADQAKLEYHATLLGIPFIDPITNGTRELANVRVDYKQHAITNPAHFIDTYEDPVLTTRYWIKRGVDEKLIDIETVRGKAVWGASKAEICAVPTGDVKQCLEILFQFTQKKTGESFFNQLREHYK